MCEFTPGWGVPPSPTWEGVLLPRSGRGYPLPRFGWIRVTHSQVWMGVPPSQVWMDRGNPFPGLDGEYPLPRSEWWYPLPRSEWWYPLSRSGWGYSFPGFPSIPTWEGAPLCPDLGRRYPLFRPWKGDLSHQSMRYPHPDLRREYPPPTFRPGKGIPLIQTWEGGTLPTKYPLSRPGKGVPLPSVDWGTAIPDLRRGYPLSVMGAHPHPTPSIGRWGSPPPPS